LWLRCTEVLPENTSALELWVSPLLSVSVYRRSLMTLPGVFGARRNAPMIYGRVSTLYS
jgi:hypothetical protein